MSIFNVLGLVSGFVQAGAMASAGRAQRAAAELDAFNTETDKVRSKIETMQRHSDRLEQYRNNTATNISTFGANLNREDASVSAFLKRQKTVAFEDIQRSDLMGMFEQAKLQQQATTLRVEGRAAEQAANIRAFTTATNAVMTFQQNMK
jgi:hypothetical protein